MRGCVHALFPDIRHQKFLVMLLYDDKRKKINIHQSMSVKGGDMKDDSFLFIYKLGASG